MQPPPPTRLRGGQPGESSHEMFPIEFLGDLSGVPGLPITADVGQLEVREVGKGEAGGLEVEQTALLICVRPCRKDTEL